MMRIAAALLALCVAGCATLEETPMLHAHGTFDVKMAPLAADAPEGSVHGRLSLDKTYAGDLVATGKGEMIAVRPGADGSGAYLAIERVQGTLAGRAGAFTLEHRGIMNRGAQELAIRIVPDSGDGALAGIAGELKLDIRDGQHFYDIAYRLPTP